MAKAKIFLDGKEILQADSFKVNGYGGEEAFKLEEIKQFILAAGSDHLPTFGGDYEGGVHLQQCPDEITPCLVELLKYQSEIKNYLEIGSAAGGSVYIFNHYFPLEKIVLIDDNKHWKHALRNEVLKGIERQELVGRSDEESIVQAVADMGIKFDLIVIDSDHSYQNARVEATIYIPFLKPGGFLFLHDTVLFPSGPGRLMRELAKEPEMDLVAEYIQPDGPKCGIGLLRRKAVSK